jgi:endonuclease/exonuclease/phosphatase family metal-dependent hydrolase
MRNFVERTMRGVGLFTAPDVILLQQVNRRSTEWLRMAFKRHSTYKYKTVLRPSPMRGTRSNNPVVKDIMGGTAVKRDDSAILINTETTRVLSRGKITLTQPDSTASRNPIHQVIPWAKVVEKGSSGTRLRMIVPSIHYPRPNAFTTHRVDRLQKVKWSEHLSRVFKQKINDRGRGDSRISVLAGDFNATECLPWANAWRPSCPKTIFWKNMRRLGYTAALRLFGRHGHHRVLVDHIFADSFVSNAIRDHKFKDYSDHGVVMAWLEDEDNTPPTPPRIARWRLTPDNHPKLLFSTRWPPSSDWQTGISHYRIYRAGEQMKDPTFLDEVDGVVPYIDTSVDLSDGRRYHYQVRAVDRAGNLSPLGPREIVDIDHFQ